MKGLQMIDHIFAMEAKIVHYVVCNLPHSGIFACDIASIVFCDCYKSVYIKLLKVIN